MTAPDPDLRRLSKAADHTGISVRSLYRYAQRWAITLVRRGNMTFVSMAQLQAWIAEGGKVE